MTRMMPTIVLLAAAGLGTALAQEVTPSVPAPVTGVPADLCAELVAFVKPPEAPPHPAAAPPQQASAVAAPGSKDPVQPSSTGGEVQQKSGLSGPVPSSGPASPPSFNQTFSTANSTAKASAPPGTPTPAPKPDEAMIARVEAAAAGSDQAGCRAAAQSMRRAGVALPAPLLALSALDLKAFTRSE